MNIVHLKGNIGSEIEAITKNNKISFVRFSVATDERYKTTDGIVKKTTWHNVKAFGNLAQYLANNASKGQLISLTGKIDVQSVEKDGVTKTYVSIIARDVLLGMKSNPKATQTEEQEQMADDEVPY